MSSIKGHTYKELMSYLEQELQFSEEENLPNLAFIDRDKNQLEQIEEGIPIPTPAIFISFPSNQWETLGKRVQKSDSTIRFRIALEDFHQSFQGSFDQDEAIKYFEFLEKVHIALQGLFGTFFSPLVRVTDGEDLMYGSLIVTEMNYKTSITDSTATQTKEYTLDLDVDIQKGEKPPEIEGYTLDVET